MGARGVEPAAQEGSQAPRGEPALQARRELTGEGLPRPWRLTRGTDLHAVLRSGTRHRTPRLDVYWRPNEVGHPRLGVIVPRFGHTAVRRNQVRRRLREGARRHLLPELPALDVVVKARHGAYLAAWREYLGDFERWVDSLDS